MKYIPFLKSVICNLSLRWLDFFKNQIFSNVFGKFLENFFLENFRCAKSLNLTFGAIYVILIIEGNIYMKENNMRTNYPKTDLQRLKEGLAQIYGEDNIIAKNEIHGLTYDITLREPLIIIEYYGIQHFYDLSTLKAEYNFKQIQIEDKRKKEYCAQRNIPLLIFTSSEKNFLTPQYIKYRIEYQLGMLDWFGEKEFLS